MPAKRPPPFSLRLSADERARLERLAKGKPLGAYIKASALNPNVAATANTEPKESRRALLAKLIARLGPVAQGLKIIHIAMERGALDLEPETEAALRTAATDIAIMKTLLMTALGIKER